MWLEERDYYINTGEQRSPEWFQARKRIPASKFAAAAGLLGEEERDRLARDLLGCKTEENDPELRRKAQHGIVTEDAIFMWYQEHLNLRERDKHNNIGETQINIGETQIKVEKVGHIVPKFDYSIGGSLDALPPEGTAEFKAPEQMYGPILEHLEKLARGWLPADKYYHEHIYVSHYCQMQGVMAITNRPWCDYVVYVNVGAKPGIYLERVLFNPAYWWPLYLELKRFQREKIPQLHIINPKDLIGCSSHPNPILTNINSNNI